VTTINYKDGSILLPSYSDPSKDALYAGTAPVITNTQSATSTIASAQKWTPAPVVLAGADKYFPFTYLGAGDFVNGTGTPDSSYVLPLSRYPNTYASGQSGFGVEFMYSGQIFEVKYKYIGTSTFYRMYVNDRKVTDLMQSPPGPPSAGTSNVLKVDLGSVDVWKIRFEFSTMPFGGIFTGPNDSMYPTLKSSRVAVLGDSLTDGSAQNTGASMGTWFKRFGRLMGLNDTWGEARGGTGYVTPGSFATFPARVNRDIVTYNPDMVIVWGGYNDVGSDVSSISAAQLVTLKAITSQLPLADVIVIGVWSPAASPGASRIAVNDVLRANALALDLPFIDPLDGNVYDRYSRVVHTAGPWITTNNVSLFVGGDAIHPTDAGHKAIATVIADSIAALNNS